MESQNSKYLGAKKLGKSVYITAQNKEKLSLKTSQDESVMNNSINTGISKYFVHLIMSKLCERTYFSNFRSFPTMKPKPFWSRHWIFLYPFDFTRYFLIFYIFNILWNWLILSKCDFKMALFPLYFLQRITRDRK